MAIKHIVDHGHPGGAAGYIAERGYDAVATVEARVLINRIHFDEGYREAEKGDVLLLSPEDFDALEAAGQVEPEADAKKRDERAAARAARGAK